MLPPWVAPLGLLAISALVEPGLAQRAYDSAGARVNDYRSSTATGAELRLVLLREFAGGPDSATMSAHSTAMRRLGDGRIAIAVDPPRMPPPPPGSPISARRLPPDAPPARREIRLFDSSARFLRNIGRDALAGFSGEIAQVAAHSDGRIIVAQHSYRWVVLTETDGMIGNPGMTEYSMLGAFEDGSVLEGLRGIDPGTDVYVGGSHFVLGTLTFYKTDAIHRARTPIGLTVRYPSMFSPPGDGTTRLEHVAFPVSVSPSAAAGADRIWTVDALKWEARSYDANGKLHVIVRMPVPANARDAAFGRQFSADSARTYRIAVDDLGRFWIDGGNSGISVSWRRPFSQKWTIYERDGRLAHSVSMPDGFYPFHFGGDFLLGRRGNLAALYSLR
jgi:hypothetical protein